MALRKIRISQLPLESNMTGLVTIGVNASNQSCKVALDFLKDTVDGIPAAILAANNAASLANNAAEEAGELMDEVSEKLEEINEILAELTPEQIEAWDAALSWLSQSWDTGTGEAKLSFSKTTAAPDGSTDGVYFAKANGDAKFRMYVVSNGVVVGIDAVTEEDLEGAIENLTKDDVGLSEVDNTSDLNKPISTAVQAALDLLIPLSQKGATNGVATLDSSGKVPSSQLPSIAFSVKQYDNFASFPTIGVSEVIYIDAETGMLFRWNGSEYEPLNAGDVEQFAEFFVRYDKAQTLTTGQKSQARANIGAAADDAVVKIATAQTITGQKGFSSPPTTAIDASIGDQLPRLSQVAAMIAEVEGAMVQGLEVEVPDYMEATVEDTEPEDEEDEVAGFKTLSLGFKIQAAGLVFASPMSAAGLPDFRALGASDIPSLAISKITGLQTALDGKQPLNASLTSISALTGTSGLLRKTGANTYALDTATYLTANQVITLSGDVSGSGATSISVTVANGAITNAKLASVSSGIIKGRASAGSGVVEDLTPAQVRTLLNVADGANNYVHPTGDGNLHVPANGTTNAGKFLKAAATAGAILWASIAKADISDFAHTHAIADVTGLQTALDGKIALSSPLTGFTVGADGAIVSTDTVLQAFGKTQGQINAIKTSITNLDNRYLRKNANDDNSTYKLTLGQLEVGNSVFTGTVTASGINIGTTETDILVRGTGGVLKYRALADLGVISVNNSAGTNQFDVALGQGIRFEGAGDTTIHFNAATRTIKIESTMGSGTGGVVTNVFGRTGSVVATAGDYNTSQITENPSALYFTQARVLDTPLTGYTIGTNTAIADTDTILQAFGKIQSQINNKAASTHTHLWAQITDKPNSGEFIYNRNSTVQAASFWVSGISRVSNDFFAGYNIDTTGGGIFYGRARSVDGTSYFDLVSSVSRNTNYDFRIQRNAGENGALTILQRGSGAFIIRSENSSDIILQQGSNDKLRIFSSGNTRIGGGGDNGTALQVNGSIWQSVTSGMLKAVSGVITQAVEGTDYLKTNQTITLTGDVAGSGATSIATTIATGAVTFAKMQTIAQGSILGRYSSGTGSVQTMTLGSGLTYNSTTGVISATGSGGTVTTISVGNLSPLFTALVSNETTTPSVAFTAVNQNANLVYAGPVTGSAAAPTFRALVAADIPNLDAAKITTGVISPARLGAGTPSASTILYGDGTWKAAPSAPTWTEVTDKPNSGEFIYNRNSTVQAASFWVSGISRVSNDFFAGYNIDTTGGGIFYGRARSVDGTSYFDLVSSVSRNTNYDFRIQRNAGEDGSLSILHRGSGSFTLRSENSSDIIFQQGASDRLRIFSSGNTRIGGGGDGGATLQVNGTIYQSVASGMLKAVGGVITQAVAGTDYLTSANIPSAQTLTYTTGSLSISLGNTVNIKSIGAEDVSTGGSDMGLVGLYAITNTDGSTGYPSIYGGGIVLQRGTGTNNGKIIIWKAYNAVNELYFKVGGNDWEIFASRTWVQNRNYLTANQTITLSGDATGSGTTSIAVTIANSAITYAKIQNVTASRLLGRYAATNGVAQEITIGTGLTLNSTTGVLSATGSGGTVTSVALSLPSIFSVGGSPVTSSGTLSASLISQSANLVFASPSGASGTPTFRSLVAADIPNLDASKITTGTISTARLGSGTASSSTYLAGDNTWKTFTAITLTNKYIAFGNSSNQITGSANFTYEGNRYINMVNGSGVLAVGTASADGFVEAPNGALLLQPNGSNRVIVDRGSFRVNGLAGSGTRYLQVNSSGDIVAGPATITASLTENYIAYGNSSNMMSGSSFLRFLENRYINIVNGSGYAAFGTFGSVAFVESGGGELWLEASSGNRIVAKSGFRIENLGGGGTRMVVTDNSGNLSAQTIPSGGSPTLGYQQIGYGNGSNVLTGTAGFKFMENRYIYIEAYSNGDSGGMAVGTWGKNAFLESPSGHVVIQPASGYEVQVTGTFRATSHSYFPSGATFRSDIRYKSNIKKLDNPLQRIMHISGNSYLHNGRHEYGLIANEVQRIMPYAITTDKDGTLFLDYNGIHALTVESIKALISQGDERDKRINELETRVKTLEKQIENYASTNIR